MMANSRLSLLVAIGSLVSLAGHLSPLRADIILSIDVDDRGAADPGNTELGFDQFLLDGSENDDQMAPTMRSFGALDVTINHANGGAYGDRRRTEPTNADPFTDQELLRDFTFARGTTPDDGLDIQIDGLTPGGGHRVTIWSFDTSSNDDRVSDWTANGVLVQDDYTFNGVDVPPDPVDNDVYKFDFDVNADASGSILIEGRYVAGPCCGVFLNALTLDELGVVVNPGDVDGDGDVDLVDFDTIRGNMFLAASSREDGDLNRDGMVFFDDFRIWKDNHPFPSTAASASVPEPTSALLAVLALAGLLRVSRREP